MKKTDKGQTIQMPVGIAYHPDLRLTEKVFLSIVYTLSKQGLKKTNQDLGRMLGLNESNTSRLIARMEAEGWVRITGKKSRWRKIYLAAGSKVKNLLLCRWEHFTLPLEANYLAAGSKHNKRKKRNNNKTSFSPSLPKQKNTSEPKPAQDPEKVRRVLAALDFEGGGL